MATKSKKAVALNSGPPELLPANGRVIAIVVGVENYQGNRFKAVPFAEADARAFSDVLSDMYDEGSIDRELLLNADATKVTLDYQIKQAIRSATTDDLFVFFYAGHGFFGSGDNYLTAFDSGTVNVSDTSVSVMSSLMKPLSASACRRALLFVDACATDVDSRAIISSFDPKQIVLPDGNKDDYHALFLSCQRGQSSYTASAERHGVWTFHLLKALRGKAKAALVDERTITDISLRDYLRKSVPAYISKNTTIVGRQTPEALIRASSTFVIRTFPIRTENAGDAADLSMLSAPFSDVYFEGMKEGSVRLLPGFDKRIHRVPANYSSATQNFVAKSAWPDVNEDIDLVYNATKELFGLRRKELSTSRSESDASGTVDCEYFRYSIGAEQNAHEVDRFIITRRLTMREPDEDTIAKAQRIFGNRVDRLVIEVDSSKWDFDDLVERFEDFRDNSGGSLQEDETKAIISYRSPNDMHLEIDVHSGRIVLAMPQGTLINLLEMARGVTFGLTGSSKMALR